MEVRISHKPGEPLGTKTFFSDESGFEVASVIIYGEHDAALVDAQWTLANAHRVVAEIMETGRRLTTVYVTHAHPDHYFGLGPIHDAFPEARICAVPPVAATINKQFAEKMEHWRNVIGPLNVPREQTGIEPLTGDHFELEGQRIEIMADIMGDLKYNTVVWVPSIRTLIGSDVLFNQAHAFTCEVTKEERAQWVKDIEDLEKLGAEVVIPGHQKPGMPFDSSSFTFTKDYIRATEEELETTEGMIEFFFIMARRFAEANLFISNHINAGFFKGGLDWNWRDE